MNSVLWSSKDRSRRAEVQAAGSVAAEGAVPQAASWAARADCVQPNGLTILWRFAETTVNFQEVHKLADQWRNLSNVPAANMPAAQQSHWCHLRSGHHYSTINQSTNQLQRSGL